MARLTVIKLCRFSQSCQLRLKARDVLPMPADEVQARLVVDWTRCAGHGLCGRLVPELVRLDRNGYELRATVVAVADEIAAAADLVRGKTAGIPAAVVRGLSLSGEGSAQELVMPRERDMFR